MSHGQRRRLGGGENRRGARHGQGNGRNGSVRHIQRLGDRLRRRRAGEIHQAQGAREPFGAGGREGSFWTTGAPRGWDDARRPLGGYFGFGRFHRSGRSERRLGSERFRRTGEPSVGQGRSATGRRRRRSWGRRLLKLAEIGQGLGGGQRGRTGLMRNRLQVRRNFHAATLHKDLGLGAGHDDARRLDAHAL